MEEKNINTSSELTKLRLEQFMSRKEFAELLNVSVNTYKSWENGSRKCPAIVIPMAKRIVELYNKPK